MDKPKRAAETPYGVEVKAGHAYFWCTCGLSPAQPFCDGSHQGTGFSPLRFDAKKDDRVLFCGCKASKNAPFCDGSHGE